MDKIDSILKSIKETISNDGKSTFAFELFNKALDTILLNSINISYIKKLCKYSKHHDIRYFTLKYVHSNFDDLKSNETFIEI